MTYNNRTKRFQFCYYKKTMTYDTAYFMNSTKPDSNHPYKIQLIFSKNQIVLFYI